MTTNSQRDKTALLDLYRSGAIASAELEKTLAYGKQLVAIGKLPAAKQHEARQQLSDATNVKSKSDIPKFMTNQQAQAKLKELNAKIAELEAKAKSSNAAKVSAIASQKPRLTTANKAVQGQNTEQIAQRMLSQAKQLNATAANVEKGKAIREQILNTFNQLKAGDTRSSFYKAFRSTLKPQ